MNNDPRKDDLPLLDIAKQNFCHGEKTMADWIKNRNKKDCNQKYPFPIYRFGTQKGNWFVSAKDFKKYRDSLHKDAEDIFNITA